MSRFDKLTHHLVVLFALMILRQIQRYVAHPRIETKTAVLFALFLLKSTLIFLITSVVVFVKLYKDFIGLYSLGCRVKG